MSYTDIIRGLLDHQYPSTEQTKTIVISNIVLRIIPLPSKPYFLRYEHLETLILSKCDLRNLENFPKLLSLKQLDISENSLHGTLNYLMPLSRLNYLNISNNLIEDFRKLQPLQMIEGLEIYVAGNPFVDGETWKTKVRNYGLKVIKQPRVIQTQSKKVKQQDKREEKKQTKEPEQPQQSKEKKQHNLLRQTTIFVQMRDRRQRRIIDQQDRERQRERQRERERERQRERQRQRVQAQQRRNLIQMSSDSMSYFEIVGQQELENMLDHQEVEQSQELNDSESSDSEINGRDPENQAQEGYLNNDFVPLLDVFDADEDMELDENVSDSPSDD